MRNALYEYGPGVIEHLALAAKKPDMPPEVAAFIPFVLERFASQTAVDALFDLLDQPDASLRQEVLRSLNTLKKTHPRLDIRQEKVIELIISEVNLYKDTLAVLYRQSQMIDNDESEDLRNARLKLIAILEQRLDSTLERIFRLLGLKYPPEEIIPVFDGIRNSSNDIRINSVEFLDNLLEPRLKKVLIPIAETAMLDAITREVITNLNVKVPDEEWCFTRLLQGKDPNLKVAVFNLIGPMGNSQYIDLVQQYTNNPFRRVREAAENALARLVKRDS